MRIGTSPVRTDLSSPIEDIVDEVIEIEKLGFSTIWLPEIFGPDPFIIHSVLARETTSITLGTAVAVAYARHPVALAKQARTLSQLSGGRFKLGIGPSHQPVIEGVYGQRYERPAAFMREYVRVVSDLSGPDQAATSFQGEFLSANAQLDIPRGGFELYLAALAPKMLQTAGEFANGVILWLSHAEHIRNVVIPHLERSAQEAGRDARPSVVAGFPICVTDDSDSVREHAAKAFAIYGQLPNYRRTFDSAGVDGPADVAIIGNESEVTAQLRELAELGVDEVWASIFPSGADGTDKAATIDRTREFLANVSL